MSRRIALHDLLADTGYKERDLWELRRRGVFPYEPQHEHIAGRPGSASSYEEEAARFLKRRHTELRRQYRLDDDLIWRLWIDPAGSRIDMRAWVGRRLRSKLESVERARAANTAGIDLAGGGDNALRAAGVAGAVRNPNARKLAIDWIVAWALNEDRPGLNIAIPGMTDPTLFDVMTKLLAGFSGVRVPSRSLKLADDRGLAYWLARFQRIVTLAFDREIQQARRDWRVIFEIVDDAARIDWNQAPPLLPPGARELRPSWQARQARRQHRKPAPVFFQQTARMLRDPDGRALIFCVLLIARRLFSRSPMPEMPDLWLGIVRQWLDGLPRLLPNVSEASP